ncbi:MAG: hypothetical protein D6730_03780 [Bacteroidetes bacterium]|nr:MAG: hypothetical protein D6730_03780 [Bacteroidota bacterium]
MKSLKYIALFIMGFALAGQGLAQTNDPLGGKDTLVLENERIEDVISSEKPPLNPPKAKLPKPETEDLRYESKDFQIETDYEPTPPEPMPIELKSEEEALYHNMVKLGIGRFVSPLFQLYLNNGKDYNVDYGLNFTHRSVEQDKLEFRKFREDYGTLNGSIQSDAFKLYGLFHMYNTAYYNYADTATIAQNPDSAKMSFTRVNVKAGIASLDDPDLPYYYDLGLALRNYDGLRGNREFHIDLLPTGGFYITEDFSLDVKAEINLISGKIGSQKLNRSFLGFAPALVYESQGFQAKLGFAWNRFKKKVDSTAFSNLGPNIEASFALFPEELSVIAGVTSGMTNNHYYDMIFENPYLNDTVDIKPTIEKLNIYGGIKGNVGQRIDYTAKVYYKRVQNPLIYFTPVGGAYFAAMYDSLMTVVGVHAEVNYDLSHDLKIGGALNFNNYKTSTVEKNFHAPPLRIDANVEYVWNKKLTLIGNMNVYSQTPVSQFQDGNIFDRSTFVNLSLSADYRVIDRFSVYLRADNILNGNYQRWYNYPERPLVFGGGLTFIF